MILFSQSGLISPPDEEEISFWLSKLFSEKFDTVSSS